MFWQGSTQCTATEDVNMLALDPLIQAQIISFSFLFDFRWHAFCKISGTPIYPVNNQTMCSKWWRRLFYHNCFANYHHYQTSMFLVKEMDDIIKLQECFSFEHFLVTDTSQKPNVLKLAQCRFSSGLRYCVYWTAIKGPPAGYVLPFTCIFG